MKKSNIDAYKDRMTAPIGIKPLGRDKPAKKVVRKTTPKKKGK
jgi:hypothetical protein